MVEIQFPQFAHSSLVAAGQAIVLSETPALVLYTVSAAVLEFFDHVSQPFYTVRLDVNVDVESVAHIRIRSLDDGAIKLKRKRLVGVSSSTGSPIRF